MRQRPTPVPAPGFSPKQGPARWRVGMLVDSSDAYGRRIIGGVASYANLQRRWILFHGHVVALEQHIQRWPELDGAIVAGVFAPFIDRVKARCRHVVCCSGAFDSATFPVVRAEDEAVGALAAKHLIDCQFRNFAFYGLREAFSVPLERLAGFRGALEEAGFACIVCPLESDTFADRLSHVRRPALIEWLRGLPKPIGILAFDDTNAQDLASACLEADIAVPDHVAIVGVNNDDLLCESAWPPLSSVDTNYTRIGYLAARMLDRLLAGERLGPEERLVRQEPLGVVQRQSTSTLATADPDLASALRYIREHACDPCSVSDVLRHVPVGRRWLERQFVAQLGRTPHDEIIRVRIEVGQRLLLRSDMSLYEIASRCGFAERKSFYHAFHKVAGTTPAAYRRRLTAP